LNLENNFFIIFLILISFTKIALGNEPTDIWSLEKEEKSSEENITIDNSSSEIENKKIKINAGITDDIKVSEEVFADKNDLVVGIYDPGKYGFELDMWSKSDGKKIYNLKKKINSMNLSKDASDIYKKILLTNTFPPKDNLDKKKFFDLKAEWLIKNGDLDLIIEYVTKNLDIISNENLIKFVLNEYLSIAEIKEACSLFKKINQNFNDYYLKNFSIYCLIHSKQNDLAMMRFDLEKESGYSDPFFEKKFN